MGDISNTQYFKAVQEDKKLEVGEVLREVYEALTEKGITRSTRLSAISCPAIRPILRAIRAREALS